MSLSRRLDEIERRMKPSEKFRGTIEIHYTEAWPTLDEAHGANLQQCREHGRSCAVSISPTFGMIRRVYIFRGPWLGIG